MGFAAMRILAHRVSARFSVLDSRFRLGLFLSTEGDALAMPLNPMPLNPRKPLTSSSSRFRAWVGRVYDFRFWVWMV